MANRRPTLRVVDWFDTNPVLITQTTPIPASTSSPLEVVASLYDYVEEIEYNDTNGALVGVYVGASGSEVLKVIIGLQQNGRISLPLSKGARISIRSMTTSPIQMTEGYLCVQFLGP